VHISCIILTRSEGDQRGGAALSMRAVTGAPIKFLGTGEKLDALEAFHPQRVASRILDMGDVVTLVERAVEHVIAKSRKARQENETGRARFQRSRRPAAQMRKMAACRTAGMLPGIGKVKDQLAAAGLDDGILKRQEAIIAP